MYHRTFTMFMFGSIFDYKFNILDIENSIDVYTCIFLCVYDHTGGVRNKWDLKFFYPEFLL